MSKEEKIERKIREWREVEEYVYIKDSEIFGMFGFDISKYWNKNLSRKEIKKKQRIRKIVENTLKVILTIIITLIISVILGYIINLYRFNR